MRPADNIEKSIKKLRYKTSAETHDRVLGNVLQAMDEKEKQKPGVNKPDIWRTIMKNTFTKIAAAIVVIAGILIGLHFAGNPFVATVTFAEVIEPILNARTVVLDYVIGEGPDALEMHDIVIGSRIRRTMSNMDMTMILDLEDARMLTLVSLGVTKIASYNDIQGTGLEGTGSVLDFVRNVVSRVKNNPDADIQDLGEKEINGQKAVGFYVKGFNDGLTIWANKKTSLPIRIEITEGKTSTVIKNIKFDVPLEESLVSMEVPAGYTMKDIAIHIIEVPAPDNHLSNATEEDLVESLRIWAEIILDGAFPDAIGTDHFIKQAAPLGYKMASLRLPVSEGEQLFFKFQKGMIFLQKFEFGGKWGYAGKGVKLGDAEKIILWYQPQGSDTYRVIYGDLSVKDIATEDLPK